MDDEPITAEATDPEGRRVILADAVWREKIVRDHPEIDPHMSDVDQVDRYIARKLDESHPLSPRSINMTVTLLGAILEGAVERELIPRNPARGRGRRVRERATRRSYLKTAEQIGALLDAAARLDASARKGRQHVERRAMIAVLVFVGLRVGELLALQWRDIDMSGGWMYVEESKTDAGRRRIKIRGALQAELVRVRERQAEPGPDRVVFATSTGKRQSADNFRSRVLRPSVTEANRALSPGSRHRYRTGLRRTLSGEHSQACCMRSVRTQESSWTRWGTRPGACAPRLPPGDAQGRGGEGGAQGAG
ncbi:MAG TPA: site-specific integrase [Solirubrobacteraceae bacterium]|jgi:integrase|nr:site-specific integrase [Solirubrobacteraceae bacterium]